VAKFLYISWARYGILATKLAGMVANSGIELELVIGIARGGIPLAMVMADQLGLKLDIINVKSYSGIAERGRVVILSTLTEDIKSKNLLLVDDLVDGGDTIETVMDFLSKGKPKSIKTAVMFTKPWSRPRPDFSLDVVEEWIVFPWERGEVARLTKRPRGTR
jgi:hypoxanthine phosphoribosyltransferase